MKLFTHIYLRIRKIGLNLDAIVGGRGGADDVD
jgi:hypothetical protein